MLVVEEARPMGAPGPLQHFSVLKWGPDPLVKSKKITAIAVRFLPVLPSPFQGGDSAESSGCPFKCLVHISIPHQQDSVRSEDFDVKVLSDSRGSPLRSALHPSGRGVGWSYRLSMGLTCGHLPLRLRSRFATRFVPFRGTRSL